MWHNLTNCLSIRSWYEQSFYAKNNFFTGRFPLSLTGVDFVDLSSNRLTSLAPKATAKDLPASVSVVDLVLSNNHISGSLPSWLSSVTTLQGFDISRNKIKGRLPVSFLQLPNLQQASTQSHQSLPFIPLVNCQSTVASMHIWKLVGVDSTTEFVVDCKTLHAA